MSRKDIQESLMVHATTYLETAGGFMIPVRSLWEQIRNDLSSEKITCEEFIDMLRQDTRFCVFDTDQKVMDDLAQWMSIEEMEEQGYYNGPRVMLKRKVPDQENVAVMLIEKADQTFQSLKQAWELRPEHDQVTEDRLLKALAKAQRLQRELRVLFSQHKLQTKKEEFTSE
jgi:hypothetical protein